MTAGVPAYHSLDPAVALARQESGRDGLAEAEAESRRVRHGPNALSTTRPRSAWRILLDQLRGVVVLLLAAAAGIALVTGDALEAAAIAVVLVLNTLLGFFTELRARRAMEALLRLEAPRAVVVREGRARTVAARDLAPGDVVLLEAGASVPADGRVLEEADLHVDEAPLTGESMPVAKSSAPVAPDAPLPERSSMVYKGTTTAAGTARVLVVATGMQTELGRIGKLVSDVAEQDTPLEQRLDALGRRLVAFALGVAAVVAGIGALHGRSLALMLETGIALAIAAVPEGLPAVATIALAVGVRRMARRRALVRRLPSVETLGSVTVVCTDKTGTLTAGTMRATTLWLPHRELRIVAAGHADRFLEEGRPVDPAADVVGAVALRIAALANRARVEEASTGSTVRGTPTDAALLEMARSAGAERAQLLGSWPEEAELPFSSARGLMATFHRAADGTLVAHVKGAPGRVLATCDRLLTEGGERRLEDTERDRIVARNEAMAGDGQRVLALACGPVEAPTAAALRGLAFVGLIGLTDPPAEGVEDTIRVLRGAGIRTVMITGDQAPTARAVARSLGLAHDGARVLGGRELQHLRGDALASRVGDVSVFSRVSPEDKLEIVAAFQARGDIVAMIGDGVNDAAALKKADVGVAMGMRGTDVAKEAADVVLQDDRFRTIGAAVEEGRVIYDNIRKFVFYLFSCNLAELLVLLIAGIAGLPLPLTPLQILWLNLVTDTFPALALALEPAERSIMKRRPRRPGEAILSGPFVRAVGFYAALITAATLLPFVIMTSGAFGAPDHAITVSFVTLALAQLFHLGTARSREPVLRPRRAFSNPWALGAVALVLVLQVLAVYAPPLVAVLDTRPLTWREWVVVLGFSLMPALIGQLIRIRPTATSAPSVPDRGSRWTRA